MFVPCSPWAIEWVTLVAIALVEKRLNLTRQLFCSEARPAFHRQKSDFG